MTVKSVVALLYVVGITVINSKLQLNRFKSIDFYREFESRNEAKEEAESVKYLKSQKSPYVSLRSEENGQPIQTKFLINININLQKSKTRLKDNSVEPNLEYNGIVLKNEKRKILDTIRASSSQEDNLNVNVGIMKNYIFILPKLEFILSSNFSQLTNPNIAEVLTKSIENSLESDNESESSERLKLKDMNHDKFIEYSKSKIKKRQTNDIYDDRNMDNDTDTSNQNNPQEQDGFFVKLFKGILTFFKAVVKIFS